MDDWSRFKVTASGIVLAVITLYILFSAFAQPIADGIRGWRGVAYTDAPTVVTAAGVHTGNITLSSTLVTMSLSDVTSISSSLPGDSPAAIAYTDDSQVLEVNGLLDSNTRTLTINYVGERSGASDSGMRLTGPFLVVIIMGGLVVFILAMAFKNQDKSPAEVIQDMINGLRGR
jgi:hypothetical protein